MFLFLFNRETPMRSSGPAVSGRQPSSTSCCVSTIHGKGRFPLIITRFLKSALETIAEIPASRFRRLFCLTRRSKITSLFAGMAPAWKKSKKRPGSPMPMNSSVICRKDTKRWRGKEAVPFQKARNRESQFPGPFLTNPIY